MTRFDLRDMLPACGHDPSSASRNMGGFASQADASIFVSLLMTVSQYILLVNVLLRLDPYTSKRPTDASLADHPQC